MHPRGTAVDNDFTIFTRLFGGEADKRCQSMDKPAGTSRSAVRTSPRSRGLRTGLAASTSSCILQAFKRLLCRGLLAVITPCLFVAREREASGHLPYYALQ